MEDIRIGDCDLLSPLKIRTKEVFEGDTLLVFKKFEVLLYSFLLR